jgi:hypothetical protein
LGRLVRVGSGHSRRGLAQSARVVVGMSAAKQPVSAVHAGGRNRRAWQISEGRASAVPFACPAQVPHRCR